MARTPSPPPTSVLRVLLDFDGTLVEENVAIELVQRFCPDGSRIAREVDEQLHRGEITLREAWERQVALLPPQRQAEMVEFARREITVREGAHDFLALMRRSRIPVTIVSGGLDFYIAPILRQHGIDLPVLSDTLHPDGGSRWTVDHPHGHATCRRCGICKAQCVQQAAAHGSYSVFVGDGSTDRYAAEVADIVFARRRLEQYCERAGIPYFPFDTFAPVSDRIARWLAGEEPLPARRGVGLRSSLCPISQALALAGSGRWPASGDGSAASAQGP